jgi:hypothetical protein
MSTNETMALLQEALKKGTPESLAKAYLQSASATSGLTAYDLEAGAKSLFPVLTPLRNAIPRVSGKGGIQANWRAITAINTSNTSPGVSQGNRGGVIATDTADYFAAYKGLGLEDYVTFEAEYAAEGFEDVRARATQNLLRALMISEEKTILGGNGDAVALGTTPTPSLSTATSGGSIGATITVQVACVALTAEGFYNATAAGIVDTTSRTNADGSTDTVRGGTAQKSAVATQATGGGTTNTVSATVAPVKGAYAYAWFVGQGGTQYFLRTTTINSILITALPVSGQTYASLASADYSKNNLVFDGLLAMAAKTGSNAYYKTMASGVAGTGTGLTAGTDGTIAEFDEALQSFWDNYRLSPDTIWVSSQEASFLRKKVLAGSSNAAQRFNIATTQNGLMGGTMVRGYINPFTMGEAIDLPIKIHPNMPAGTILFTTNQLPYPLSGITNVMNIRTRREYYQLEWPQKSRKYEYGVYVDEVLQHYAPFSLGIITNIAAA